MNEEALISRHMLDTGEKIVVTEVWDVGHPACPFNVMAAYESQLWPGQRQYEVDRAEFCAKPLRAKGGLELVTPATLKRDAPTNNAAIETAAAAAFNGPSEMVLRIAKVLRPDLFTEVTDAKILAGDKVLFGQRRKTLAQARDVLEAMREPTEAMKALDKSLAPFWDNSVPPHLISKLGSHTGAYYGQMIDEALK